MGNYAKIISPTSETGVNISQIDEQTAWLAYKDLQMKINRKTGVITMVQGTRYRKVVCEKTVFTMQTQRALAEPHSGTFE